MALARDTQRSLEAEVASLQHRPSQHVFDAQWNLLAGQLDTEVKRCDELKHQASFYEEETRSALEQLREAQTALAAERAALKTATQQQEEAQVAVR